MGIGKTIQTFDIADVSGGCNYTDDLPALTKNQSPNSMNIEFMNGRIRKRKGFTWFSEIVDPNAAVGHSLIDFGNVEGAHKQVAHFGAGVYACTNLQDPPTMIRAAAPDVRSFNARVRSYLIQTYEDYSAPYYWDGKTELMSELSSNAPGFKKAIEFQGYLIGMNTEDHPMRAYYQSVSNLIGEAALYEDYFTFTPAPNDDELTEPFLLNGRLYSGTKYSIFRASFVGGTTVFEFKQVISDVGILPNTLQVVVTKEFGQVAIFLGYDKRVYMFDGANLKTLSDLFFYHNKDTAIALDLIDDARKEQAFSVFDTRFRVYRLFVTRKAGDTNYYCMNIDVDTFSYYPFDNMVFSAGAMCYDGLLRPVLVGLSYSGALYKLFVDSNTDDGDDIVEYYESPMVAVKDPYMKQGASIIIHMNPVSNANLLVYDKVDFARVWSLRQKLPLASSRDKFLGRSFVLGSSALGSEKDIIHPQIGINVIFNHYQFRLQCDTPKAPAWEVYEISVNQALLAFGEAEPQR